MQSYFSNHGWRFRPEEHLGGCAAGQETPTSVLSVYRRHVSKDHGYDSSSFSVHDFVEDDEGDEEVFHLELGDEYSTSSQNNDDLNNLPLTNMMMMKKKAAAGLSSFTTDNVAVSAVASSFCQPCEAFQTPGDSPPSKKVVLHTSFQPDAKKPLKPALAAARSNFRPENPNEYALDVYYWKLELEKRHAVHLGRNVLQIQPDITLEMRRTLLQWLVAVNRQFQFTLDTLCLALSVMDRFLTVQPINKDCLQLVGLTSFFIAAKQEEVEPPEISELVSLCARSYSAKQFRWMEFIILSHVKFELMVPTLAFFLDHLIETGDPERRQIWPRELTRKLMEILLCETRFSRSLPSKMAAKLYDFLSRNFVMTCLVANMNHPLATTVLDVVDANPNVVNNFYHMLYLDLQAGLKDDYLL